jgi:hypothetical protein
LADRGCGAIAIDPFDHSHLYAETNGHGVFSINVKPSLTVTSPNGGEIWSAGSLQNISWTTTGPVGNLKVEYSSDGGASYTVITDSIPNTGTYSWTVPFMLSSKYLVRISEAGGGGVRYE